MDGIFLGSFLRDQVDGLLRFLHANKSKFCNDKKLMSHWASRFYKCLAGHGPKSVGDHWLSAKRFIRKKV